MLCSLCVWQKYDLLVKSRSLVLPLQQGSDRNTVLGYSGPGLQQAWLGLAFEDLLIEHKLSTVKEVIFIIWSTLLTKKGCFLGLPRFSQSPVRFSHEFILNTAHALTTYVPRGLLLQKLATCWQQKHYRTVLPQKVEKGQIRGSEGQSYRRTTSSCCTLCFWLHTASALQFLV